MFRQIEAPASEWPRLTRVEQLEKKISELERIRSLIPTEEDFLKYSLTADEVLTMFPSNHRFYDELRINRWRNAVNGIMVVLRKRDAENPEMQISFSELKEAINVLIDNDPSRDAVFVAISVLGRNGLIDTNYWQYVNIARPKVEGGVPVPF